MDHELKDLQELSARHAIGQKEELKNPNFGDQRFWIFGWFWLVLVGFSFHQIRLFWVPGVLVDHFERDNKEKRRVVCR